ncbi:MULTISPECIES: YlbL family protein [Actinomadura]|uniref:endopeptidase La n=2 Tax=Actinomadura madurae TaxID=1993 RepID=A0A1I5J4R7_9ACTN|nr:PDZ domain-containing protein [Actinomadura madurae]SFO67386.1 PDZ domain-containing protein [Actinomadura madurae]SPT58635.1 DNA-binding ATP-dependent protease La [Actinomadura madurae]
MSRRATTLSVASVLVLLLAVIGSVMRVPYVALMPGPTRNTLGTDDKGQPLIRIEGRRTYPVEGNLNFTTVTYRGGPGGRIDLFTALRGWIAGDTAIVPEETIFPKDESPKQVDQENTQAMQDSQQSAEAAALHQLRIPVTTRAVVDGVQKGRPADGVLKPGDEITALDGAKVTSVSQITGAMAKHKIGDSVQVTYKRAGTEQKATIKTAADPTGKRAVVGIVLSDQYKFPFKIDISIGDIGGPSAGLMFSLAIVDKLTEGPLTRGAFIAGTGTITPEGQVGPIGGIQQKMIAARQAGATVFLTPKDNCADAMNARPDGLRLVRADTLDTTLKAIDALNTGQGAVPACTK